MKVFAVIAIIGGAAIAVWACLPAPILVEPAGNRVLGFVIGLTCIGNGVMAWRSAD